MCCEIVSCGCLFSNTAHIIRLRTRPGGSGDPPRRVWRPAQAGLETRPGGSSVAESDFDHPNPCSRHSQALHEELSNPCKTSKMVQTEHHLLAQAPPYPEARIIFDRSAAPEGTVTQAWYLLCFPVLASINLHSQAPVELCFSTFSWLK